MNVRESHSPALEQGTLPPLFGRHTWKPTHAGFNVTQGQCERTMQDVVERIWDFIDDFNLNSVLKFLKDNIVGSVVVIREAIQ